MWVGKRELVETEEEGRVKEQQGQYRREKKGDGGMGWMAEKVCGRSRRNLRRNGGWGTSTL